MLTIEELKQEQMMYLILNRNKKVIKQFNDYEIAFAYCKEMKNKQLVYMMCVNANTFRTEQVVTF